MQILTIDRHDDAAQGQKTVKLPGYSGAAGLPSNDEAMDILEAKKHDGNGNAETTGGGHISKENFGQGENVNGHANGQGNGYNDQHFSGHNASLYNTGGSQSHQPFLEHGNGRGNGSGNWGGDPYSNLGPRMVGHNNV